MKTKLIAICLMLGSMPAVVYAQDSLVVARDLYASASYDEALGVLRRLDGQNTQAADKLAINQYRAFCLLALGRTVEAEQAIEGVVTLDPLYRPADTDASPRLRTAFATVRQRILPTFVQQEYDRAKAAYDRQNFPVALTAFGRVLEALGDPDLGAAAGRPPLADLRTLAIGFRELSAKAAEPPPVAAAAAIPAPAVVPMPSPAVPATSAMSSASKAMYTSADNGVVPPGVIRQVLPPYQRDSVTFANRGGIMEVVINEVGDVLSASMVTSVSPRYDIQLIAAAKKWKYTPATVGGRPVRFRKVININLSAGN